MCSEGEWSCPGLGWDGVGFVASRWCSAMFWRVVLVAHQCF